MSTDVVSVGFRTELAEAARLMREEKVGSLPVVEGRRVLGILAETDLLRQICRADAACPPECAEIIVPYP
jgi:CBS domain-containing protein